MATHLAHVTAIELGQVFTFEDDLTVGRFVELQDCPAGGRLTATGLADETQRLSGFDVERDAIDGLNRADLSLEDDSPREGEVHHQIVDGQERVAGAIALRAVPGHLGLRPRCGGWGGAYGSGCCHQLPPLKPSW